MIELYVIKLFNNTSTKYTRPVIHITLRIPLYNEPLDGFSNNSLAITELIFVTKYSTRRLILGHYSIRVLCILLASIYPN